MSPSGQEPRARGSSAKPSIQDKVSHFYYAHGLFCSTYPISVISVAISVALLCCFPLVHLPLPGNAPLQLWTSAANTTFLKEPYCYIQQVVLRIGVFPWEPNLTLGDAFRAPIYEVFKLLEVVRNFEHEQSSKSLGHICLHVEATERTKYQKVLPQYSCLVLSPANLWQQDVHQFAQDNSILTTIFNQHSLQKGKSSITEMLFGMHLFDSGIKRYPFRNRPRVIQYAITLFFKEHDKQFVDALREKLQSIYPLHQDMNKSIEENAIANNTLIIQYPGEINYFEFVPITISFVALFLYYYFSVRKIELIKSKFGMAFSALVTVFGSLAMTLGLCFFFGLTLTLQGKEIFPYLVILVGLENVLVLTKSVVSSPQHLDVKIRLAQGLSREGWSITKNLMLEITILTFGLFTFVPVIQEFCIFAIVGLITDFFLQMLFFSTILGIDIRRMENQVEKTHPSFRTNLYQSHAYHDKYLYGSKTGMNRSKSHPRLNSFPTNVVAGHAQGAQEKKIPKRVRLVNIWARTRFFQRAFMILMVVWIIIIAYNSGIIEHYILNSTMFVNRPKEVATTSTEKEPNFSPINILPLLNTNSSFINVNYVTHSPFEIGYQQSKTTDMDKLKHPEYSPWLKLSLQHWPSILKKYNLSLSGQIVAILPSIKLSHVVRPEEAVMLRNPTEKYGDKFQWQTLAAALDPLEFTQDPTTVPKTPIPQSEQPFYPTSPMEIMLTTILCIISLIVLAYIFVVLYRCVCTRNYPEWRASWCSDKSDGESGEDQVLLEALPLVLDGHHQQIECLATDGNCVISACLGGKLKVWDNIGEHLRTIDRRRSLKESYLTEQANHLDNGEASDPESSLKVSNGPTSRWSIDTNFSNIKPDSDQSVNATPCYDFTKTFSRYEELTPHKRIGSFTKLIDRLNCDAMVNCASSGSSANKSVHSLSESSKSNSCDSDNSSFSSSVSANRKASDNSDGCNRELSTLWCVDFVDNLIAVGCDDGRIEFWDSTTGQLKYTFGDGIDAGVTHIKIIGSRVIAARLNGALEFLKLQTDNHGCPIDWNFTRAYKRTHVRTGSFGSMTDHSNLFIGHNEDDLECVRVSSVKAHQQPIICMDCEGGWVVTGSQDHTLKVFSAEDGSALYTLHGHCGPITCVFIDRVCPATSGSGSQDGTLCVWDLITGTCMYNIQAHNGTIVSLTYSPSYVISLGTDDKVCVWERFQGHLLKSIQLSHSFTSQVLMLAPHLVITAKNGGLAIWNVRSGDCVRTISLGSSPFIFIKQLILLRDAVLCDYGNKLGFVRFPLITRKTD